jgi:hypothetical protein
MTKKIQASVQRKLRILWEKNTTSLRPMVIYKIGIKIPVYLITYQNYENEIRKT